MPADPVDLSPEEIHASFMQVRHHFASRFERQAAEAESARTRGVEWRARRPLALHREVLKSLQITHEALDRHMAEVGVAHRQHDEEVRSVRSTGVDQVDLGLPPAPGPDQTAAFPYATVRVGGGESMPSADDLQGFEGVGNPDAWKVAGFSARQTLLLDRSGTGTGLYDATLFERYHHTEGEWRQWYFLHMPFGDGGWSCSADPWFHGAYHCWAERDFLARPWACVRMDATLTLVPFGATGPRWQDAQESSDRVIDCCGGDVDEDRWGGWAPSLAPLVPAAPHRQKPHWIVVTASGAAGVCGESHAMLDFQRGWTSTGSIEGGSYRVTPYGLYCRSATIHW